VCVCVCLCASLCVCVRVLAPSPDDWYICRLLFLAPFPCALPRIHSRVLTPFGKAGCKIDPAVNPKRREQRSQGRQTRTQDEDTSQGHQTRTQDEDTKRGRKTRTQDEDARRGHKTRTQDKDTGQGDKPRTPRTPLRCWGNMQNIVLIPLGKLSCLCKQNRVLNPCGKASFMWSS
jgi:hypothetical protein